MRQKVRDIVYSSIFTMLIALEDMVVYDIETYTGWCGTVISCNVNSFVDLGGVAFILALRTVWVNRHKAQPIEKKILRSSALLFSILYLVFVIKYWTWIFFIQQAIHGAFAT